VNISDVSENMNAGSLILKGIRKVASEDGNGRVKSEDTNPLERDVKNEDSSRDDIDFADTAYQDFYPYLEVDKTAVDNISQKVINAPSEPLITSDIKEPTNLKYNISYPTEARLAEELRIIEALQREIESSRMGLDADKKAFEEETEAVRTRMRQKISSEKYLLKHESLVLERKRKGLDERMKKVEQKERDLVIRETIVSEARIICI